VTQQIDLLCDELRPVSRPLDSRHAVMACTGLFAVLLALSALDLWRLSAAHPGAVQLWLGGHTHTHPDDTYGGKSHIERKWGTYFLNVCALTRYHAPRTTMPMSRLLTFVDGSPEVRVQCYLHTSQYASQGWYPPAERTLHLAKPFRWSAPA
jgi:hypothetical protein